MRAVTTGTAQVDQVVLVLELDWDCELAHHLGCSGDFADRLLLHTQPHQKRGHARGAHLALHHGAYQLQHFVVENLAMLDAPRQCLGVRDRHVFTCVF